jgi:hypothetical protein
MKHLVLLLATLLLAVASSFGQQLTRVETIAGDSTIAMVNRGGIEYLQSGVIWVAVGDYPHTGKNIAYLSTDNGATWVKRPITTNAAIGSPGNVTCFTAKDANTAIAGLGTGEILRTTNSGVTWDTVTSYSDGFFDGVRFVSGDTVIAYGDASVPPSTTGTYVGRSVDAGKTWTRVASLPGDSLNTPNIYAGYASYGNGMATFGRNVWLTLYNTTNDPPSILKSTDAGSTWSWFRVTLPGGPALNYYIRSITFKDANVGFAVCKRAYVNAATNDNYLVRTTDGGRTWSDTISVEQFPEQTP